MTTGSSDPLEPIRETAEAIEDYGPFTEGDLLAELRHKAELVRAIVPECVGVSIGSLENGITFTVAASDNDAAALDAVQYLCDGPCVEAVRGAEVQTFSGEDRLDEPSWQLFAQATAGLAVRSSLTLPIVVGGEATGSVNLYASTPGAFHGHHEQIAEVFGAWAGGAVTNADLSFSTRRTAEQAPTILRAEYAIAVACGYIAGRDRIDLDTARARLAESARRAGISEAEFAGYIAELGGLDRRDGPCPPQ